VVLHPQEDTVPTVRSTPFRHPASAAAPSGAAVLLTDDDELADAVSRLAAAAGCALRRDSGPSLGSAPGEAPLLLLAGADVPAAEVLRARAEAAETVLVGLAPVDADWWRRAAEVDADHAAVLPEAESWLLERLADAGEGAGGAGSVVGVLGGCGGAGASLLAAALASAAAEEGGDVLLLDADPMSGGLDLVLGADELPGLRWGDLAGVAGRLRPDVLRSTVTVADGLQLLTGDRRRGGAPGPAALESVLTAARRLHDLVVVDLPRRDPAALATVLPHCGEVLLVVPGTYRAAAAACCVLDAVRPALSSPHAVGLVVRDVGADVVAETVADVVGARLAGRLRTDRELDAALERGEGLPRGRRTPLRAFAQRWAQDGEAGLARAAAPAGVRS